MKNIVPILSAVLLSISAVISAQAQTEGFNVKTPVETLADNSSKFLNDISADAKIAPKNSIPQDIICRAECYLVIPSVETIPSRHDFAGSGLLGCRTAGSGKLTPPIFFQITNLDSFNESGGGLIILVMDRKGVKSILGDQLQLTPDNATGGRVGSESDVKTLKSFIAYARPAGNAIQGFDASGSTLVYGSGDTFNAYQQGLDPIDIMLFGIDVPPVLRGFNTSLEGLRKGCK